MKTGEWREFDFPFSIHYRESRLAGKIIHFKMQLKSIKKEILPELNSEFAKKFQTQTINELREKIQKELERENEQRAEKSLRNSIIEELINENPIPLPESLVEEEKKELLKKEKDRLKIHKLTEEKAKKILNKQEIEKSAKHNTHARYLLKELIDELQIKVKEEEVEQITKKYPHLRQQDQNSKKEVRENILWGLSINKAIDFLLEKAEIIESEKKPTLTEKNP